MGPKKLDGIPIQWKSQVKHLGNVISHDLCDSHDIKAKKHIFISQVNTLNNKFSSISCTTRGKLFQTYCCAWYGCQTWDLNTKMTLHMNIEWNKAVRRTMRIPYDTRTCLLYLGSSEVEILEINTIPESQSFSMLLWYQKINMFVSLDTEHAPPHVGHWGVTAVTPGA